MSRVAAIIVVGLCFLAGCQEKTEPVKMYVSQQSTAKNPSENIYIVTDPNGLAAIQNLIEIEPQMQNEFFILQAQPEPGVDYKMIAVKPNPNIDYKILNPMQKNHESLMRELKERQDTEKHNKIFEVPSQLPDPNR